MSYLVKYTESALDDTESTVEWLTESAGVDAARRYTGNLRKVITTLELFPQAYPASEDSYLRRFDIRVAQVGSRKIYHRVSEYRAVMLDDHAVEHSEVGGIEGIVVILRVLPRGREPRSLLLDEMERTCS